jgi:hypothetical protein
MSAIWNARPTSEAVAGLEGEKPEIWLLLGQSSPLFDRDFELNWIKDVLAAGPDTIRWGYAKATFLILWSDYKIFDDRARIPYLISAVKWLDKKKDCDRKTKSPSFF